MRSIINCIICDCLLHTGNENCRRRRLVDTVKAMDSVPPNLIICRREGLPVSAFDNDPTLAHFINMAPIYAAVNAIQRYCIRGAKAKGTTVYFDPIYTERFNYCITACIKIEAKDRNIMCVGQFNHLSGADRN